MADWTDGPEYAPTQRPTAFVEPDAAPLSAAPEPPAPAERPLAERPAYAPVEAPSLGDLAAPAAPHRDPRAAFEVVGTPMTSWTPPPAHLPRPVSPGPDAFPPSLPPSASSLPPATGWGAAHVPQQSPPPEQTSWTPQRPFPAAATPGVSHQPGPPGPGPSVNPPGFPVPGPPPWQQPTPPPFGPVTLKDVATQTTPGVLICLALGALVSPLSLPLLVIASILASRIRYRRTRIRRFFSWALYGAVGLGLLAEMLGTGAFVTYSMWESVVSWARWACLAMLIVVPLTVGDALRRRERPEDLT
ncbi:MAG: hypothetical protein IPL36_02170 [Nigerium sp.]|nr:hypothetical protein [Nigerium sp.]